MVRRAGSVLAVCIAAWLSGPAGCSSTDPAVEPGEVGPVADVPSAPRESGVGSPEEPAEGSSPGRETPAGGEGGSEPAGASAPVSDFPPLPEGHHPGLLDPSLAAERAPDTFRVRFETTAGVFVVVVTREWAPLGADRFYNLCRIGYYDGVAFFRVLASFIAQFGVHGHPAVNAAWSTQRIPDEPVVESNRRGLLAFAKADIPDSRTTQVFINLANSNAFLDDEGLIPFGRVVEGMEVVDRLHSGYRDAKSAGGAGPEQAKLQVEGNEYLEREFPELDYIRNVTVVEGD